MKFKEYIYENGAHLYYKKNKINKSTVIKIMFDCGSRCDGDKPGLAHFCEHMFFAGTKTENKKDISKQYFDFVNTNAYTNSDCISFVGTIFTNELDKYLQLVEKMINKSTFSKKAVEDEKSVVLQEIVRDSDAHRNHAMRKLNYLMYDKKCYLNGALGTEKSVKTIESKDVKAFVKKYFIANNCSIFINSPKSFKYIKKLINQKLLSKLKVDDKFEKLPIDSDSISEKCIMDLTNKEIEKNFLNINFKLNYSFCNLKDVIKLSALSKIIGDISDGILKHIRLEKGLVYSAYTDYDTNKYDCGLLFGTEMCSENIKPCIEELAKYVQNLNQEGVSQQMLDKYKREMRYAKETYIKRPRIGDLEEYRRTGNFITMSKEDKIIEKLTVDDLNETVHKIFDHPRIVCSVFGNAKKEQVFSLKELKQLFKCE